MQSKSPRHTAIPAVILGALLTFGLGLAIAQTTQRNRTLAVKGYDGQIPVVQLNGKSYVEVESLARLTNGTLSFQGAQTTLTLAAHAATAPPDQPVKSAAFSKDFVRAGIDALTIIREWRVALVTAIRNNQPIADDSIAAFRRNVESKLTLATSAATNDSDRDAMPFLNNELGNIQRLSDKYLALQKSRTYVAPESVDNEPLDRQVQNCAAGLSTMIAGPQFQDVPACH